MIKKYQILLIAFIGLFFFQSTDQSGCERQELASGNWEEINSKDVANFKVFTPIERHEAAFVRVGDQLCLIGGRGMKPTSIFDVKTEQWTNHDPPPIEMHHLQPVVYQDKVYIMGAFTGPWPGETPIEHIYIYDPKTDEWQKGSKIPADRNRGAAGAFEQAEVPAPAYRRLPGRLRRAFRMPG